MSAISKEQELEIRCQELEMTVRLWMAANEAKSDRIDELEKQVQRLQQRMNRLSRQASRNAAPRQARRANSAR